MTQRITTILLIAAAAMLLPSCNIIGPAVVLVHGPEKTPAQFKLAKERPTIVFVDDRENVLARRTFRTQIARAIQETLLQKGVLTNVIETSAAMAVASRESAGEPLDIASIGRAAQAEVVIYVTMNAFVLSPDGQTYIPQSKAHVKVIDVAKGERLWPDKEKREGFPVDAMLNNTSGTVPSSPSDQLKGLSALADRTGLLIAQLFYDHETRESINQGK